MSGWCGHCQDTGEIDCLCGGDICICENYGRFPCPHCDGRGGRDDDEVEGDDDRTT